MMTLVAVMVICVVGSSGLRLEEIKKGSKLDINQGSILEKVRATLKKQVLGLEARNGDEQVEEVEDGKELVERGDQRRKKKRRHCRGKTKGTAFKVSSNCVDKQCSQNLPMLALFQRRGRATLRDVSPTHVKGPLQNVWKKNCFMAIRLKLFFLQAGQESDEPGAQRGEQ